MYVYILCSSTSSDHDYSRNLTALVTARTHANNIVNPAHLWLSDCQQLRGSTKVTYAMQPSMPRTPCVFVTFGVLFGSHLVESHEMMGTGLSVKDLQLVPLENEFPRTISYIAQLLGINHAAGVGVRIWNDAVSFATKAQRMSDFDCMLYTF